MPHRRVLRLLARATTATVAIGVSAGAAAAPPPIDPVADPAPMITLCHATSEGDWTPITISANAVLNGHAHHADDIIPPFAYVDRGESVSFGGANLGPILADGTTGQQILDAGCEAPATTTTTTAATTTTTTTPTSSTTTTTTTTPIAPAPTAPTATSTTTTTPIAPAPTAPTTTTTTTTTTTRPPAVGLTPGRPSCGDGEVAWNGRCYVVPNFVLPDAPLAPIPPEISVPVVSPPAPAPAGTLTPTVDCVDSDGSTNVAWFGYRLTAERPVTVPRGPDNELTPAGTPPTLFGPGRHAYVVRVTTTATTATWTLAGTTAVADASAPRCDDLAGPTTTEPNGGTDGGTPTTEPNRGTDGGCPAGARAVDDDCVAIEPVELVLVDNVIECSGESIAVFGAYNPNDQPIDRSNATSSLAPTYLDGTQPELVLSAVARSDEGAAVAGLFAVRYVGVVTWDVSHDGRRANASAGASTARPVGECTGALGLVAGVAGVEPGALATTGGDRLSLWWPIALLVAGGVLVVVGRGPARPRT